MARDVTIAKELADIINGSSLSLDFDCEFKYDQYIENERVDSIKVRVSVESDDRERKARSQWHRSCALSVVMTAPQQVNNTINEDADAGITSLLDLWDEILDLIEASLPSGHPATTISSYDGVRFDKEKLHDDRQFRAGAIVTYLII